VGSSGGSAVAVSANIVPLAFGTETDTSIINPASINGVVGIKPTVGLTSRSGVIPISQNMDSVGSFGRMVADAVIGLSIIAGEDERDPFTLSPNREPDPDYSQFLSSKDVLRGARFGLPWKRCWQFVPDDERDLAQSVFTAIEENGGEIVFTDFPCAEDRIATDGHWDW
jgi:amidase